MGLSLTAAEVIESLRMRHARMSSDWVCLREAFAIDVLAMGVSRGQRPPYYRRISYEVKVSRSDFRSELKKWPGKAQRAIDFSHEYAFAVPRGLLKPEELKRRKPWPGDDPRLWVPERAALIEVSESGDTRRRVNGEIRDTAKDISPYELSMLLRYAHRPAVVHGAEERRYQANYAERMAKAAKDRALDAEQRAVQKLAALGAVTAQPGTEWLIDTHLAPYMPGYSEQRCLVTVDRVDAYPYGPGLGVWIERKGALTPVSVVDLGTFLLYADKLPSEDELPVTELAVAHG